MPRATNAVARKRRKKKVLEQAKGYFGRKHSSYRLANEQVMRSDAYAYRDRRARKRDFRRLWITRINAAARQRGHELLGADPRPQEGRGRGEPQDARRHRRQRSGGFRRFVELAREAAAGLAPAASARLPGRSAREPPFLFQDRISNPEE